MSIFHHYMVYYRCLVLMDKKSLCQRRSGLYMQKSFGISVTLLHLNNFLSTLAMRAFFLLICMYSLDHNIHFFIFWIKFFVPLQQNSVRLSVEKYCCHSNNKNVLKNLIFLYDMMIMKTYQYNNKDETIFLIFNANIRGKKF